MYYLCLEALVELDFQISAYTEELGVWMVVMTLFELDDDLVGNRFKVKKVHNSYPKRCDRLVQLIRILRER